MPALDRADVAWNPRDGALVYLCADVLEEVLNVVADEGIVIDRPPAQACNGDRHLNTFGLGQV